MGGERYPDTLAFPGPLALSFHPHRHAPVAQLDRALPSGGRGQRFESSRARQLRCHFLVIPGPALRLGRSARCVRPPDKRSRFTLSGAPTSLSFSRDSEPRATLKAFRAPGDGQTGQ